MGTEVSTQDHQGVSWQMWGWSCPLINRSKWGIEAGLDSAEHRRTGRAGETLQSRKLAPVREDEYCSEE